MPNHAPADSYAREKTLLSLIAILLEDVTQAEADADHLDAEVDRLDLTIEAMEDGLTDPATIERQVEKALAEEASEEPEHLSASTLQGILLSMRTYAGAGDLDALAAYGRYVAARRECRAGGTDREGNPMTARQARFAALNAI